MTFEMAINRALPDLRPVPDLKDLSSPIALFLDLDGVLAPIMPRPEMVVPEPARTHRLTALQTALSGRLAILSGRTLSDIDRICEGAVTAVAGVHGLELRHTDGSVRRDNPTHVQDVFEEAFALAARHRRLMVENKALAIAIHYRHAPELQEEVRRFAADQARLHGLSVQSGHFVEEIRPKGRTKGDALSDFMSLPPFAGAVPVVLGDDLTDEHAFAAAEDWGGVSIRVTPDGPTQARYYLSGPDAVSDWLDDFLNAVETQV